MADASPVSLIRDDQVPRGFRFAAVRAGLKTSGKPDLACAVADQPVTAAAMFTSNYNAPYANTKPTAPPSNPSSVFSIKSSPAICDALAPMAARTAISWKVAAS